MSVNVWRSSEQQKRKVINFHTTYLILQDRQRALLQLTQIRTNQNRALRNHPKSHMRTLLVLIQRTIPHLQHIQIIEPARCSILRNPRRGIRNASQRGPAIRNITTHAPRVAIVLAPCPHAVSAPLAHGEQDRTSGFRERIAHLGVVRLRGRLRRPTCLRHAARRTRRVTRIMFPVIDAPLRNRLCVLLFVALGSRPPRTRHGSCVAVEAEFEALAVNAVDGGLHALWPFGRVGDEVSRAVALLGGPAVVDVEVGVAGVFEAQGDEAVGDIEGGGLGGVGATAVVLGDVVSGGRSEET